MGVPLPRRPVVGSSWGRPAFVKRAEGSQEHTPGPTNGREGATQSSGTTKQTSGLSEHELKARAEILARQNATGPTPGSMDNPSPRYTWDPKTQRAIQESLRKPPTEPSNASPSGSSFSPTKDLGSTVREDFLKVTRRDTGPLNVSSFSRTPHKSHDDPGDNSGLASILGPSSFSPPGLQRPERAQPKPQPIRDTLSTSRMPLGSRSGWGTMAKPTRNPFPEHDVDKPHLQHRITPWKDATHHSHATNINEHPKPTFHNPPPSHRIGHSSRPLSDDKIYSPRKSTNSSMFNDITPRQQPETTDLGRNNNRAGENNSWGLLTRKIATEKTSSKDFWSDMSKNLDSGSSSEPKVLSDWGLEYDRNVQYRKTSVTPTDNSPSSIPEPVQDDTDSKPEMGFSVARNARRAENFVVEPVEERGPQGRERGRDSYEAKKGRKGYDKPKRSNRGSRYQDDMFEEDDAFDRYEEKRRLKAQRKAQKEAEYTGPIPIHLPELISITALADALKIKHDVFLEQLAELGFEGVTLDSLMAGETAALVAQEYGFEPIVDVGASRDLKPRPIPEDPSLLPPRPPVVTIMGHVDHGKTTLLDYLRKSSVAAQEHGGITQHIGAFSVSLSSGKVITFLDTPGHAAFLTMRERGAQVTDIVVLVVAADDSVKPQTIEALKHAHAHKVPIIVAINKIDKDGTRIDQVKADLARNGVEIEDFGGEVQVVLVSGKTGQGMDDLEENILTLSEILDMRAEPDGPAEGWVLESSLKSIGKTATVLVKRGTLRPGDHIAAGLTWAKIRHMRNEAGVDIVEAPPGTPVEILGWRDLPAAGDQVLQGDNEDRVKAAVEYREGLHEREKDAADQEAIAVARRLHQERRAREKAAVEDSGFRAPVGGNWNSRKASLYLQAKQQAASAVAAASAAEDLAAAAGENQDGEGGQGGATKIVNFVVKGDVHGSVEAVCAAIQEIGNHEVRPRVLRAATGPVTEFDVEHAEASGSVIVDFATATPGHVRRLAEQQGVRVLEHNIIYHLVDDVKDTLSKYLDPEISSHVLGEAEVLQIFPINVKGRTYKNVAGCRVRNGVVSRGAVYRVFRHGKKVFDGEFFLSFYTLSFYPVLGILAWLVGHLHPAFPSLFSRPSILVC